MLLLKLLAFGLSGDNNSQLKGVMSRASNISNPFEPYIEFYAFLMK
jgi:hypothetical protein